MKTVHRGRELWNRALPLVESDTDDLVTRLGAWTAEKVFYVGSYLAQTTHAITGNRAFPGGIVYVDLFCGNGICVDKDTQKRFPGAALLAALCAKPLRKLLLVDQSERNVEVLKKRMTRSGSASEIFTVVDDANSVIDTIIANIPPRSLSIAFLDPWSLGIHFNTISVLTHERRTDLLILFPDAMDIDRNVNEYYYPRRSDKLDMAMGDEGEWRKVWDRVKNKSAEERRHAMVEHYLQRLSMLGYEFHDAHAIRRGGSPLYRVVYASKDRLGLKFWRIAVSEDLHGQRLLF